MNRSQTNVNVIERMQTDNGGCEVCEHIKRSTVSLLMKCVLNLIAKLIYLCFLTK